MTAFTFEEQIKFFRKKLAIPSENYMDIYGEMHNYAFAVAGANTVELITYFKEAVTAFIEQGDTLEDFRKRFDEIVDKTGWEYKGGRNWRTKVIYDTNLYSSYNHGRYIQQRELMDVLPYWQYQHNDNAYPRLEHLSWDGLVLPATDSWWDYHYPIRAYGCHCTVQALDDYDLQQNNLKVSTAPKIEWEEKIIGKRLGNPQLVRVPKGVDPGFEHKKSLTPIAQIDQMLMHKLEQKSRQPHTGVTKEFVSKAVRKLLDNPAIMQAMNQSMKGWVNDISRYVDETDEIKKAQIIAPIQNFKYLGTLPTEVLSKLPIEAESAMIAIDKGQMIHALRELKQSAGIALPVEFWESLPSKIQYPDAILWDKNQAEPSLLFIYQTEQGKVSIKINYEAKPKDLQSGKNWATKMNMVITGSSFKDTTALKDFDVLWGTLQ